MKKLTCLLLLILIVFVSSCAPSEVTIIKGEVAKITNDGAVFWVELTTGEVYRTRESGIYAVPNFKEDVHVGSVYYFSLTDGIITRVVKVR